MSIRRNLLRELVSHDGLKDSLTGAMAFPAFIDSAMREISSAERNKVNLNLHLVSIIETNSAGERAHIARIEREIDDRSEDELYALAAQVSEVSFAVKTQLRANDLVTRYTFAEFLIMNSGNTTEITKKLREVVANFDAAVVGIEMIRPNSQASLKNPDGELAIVQAVPPKKSPLESAIYTLERNMAELLATTKISAE